MKTRNNSATLINPMHPHDFNACMQWYRFSLLIIACLITALTIYSGYHAWHMLALKAAYARTQIPQTTSDVKHLQTYQNKCASLAKKIEEMNTFIAKKAAFLHSFNLIIQLLPPTVCLTHVAYAHESLTELSGHAVSFSALTNFLQALQKHPSMASLQIVTLHPYTMPSGQSGMHFVLEKKS